MRGHEAKDTPPPYRRSTSARTGTRMTSPRPGPLSVRTGGVAGALILCMLLAVFIASYLLVRLFALPASLPTPLAVRLTGGTALVGGVALGAWVFQYRSPSQMIASTHLTLLKLVGRVPVASSRARAEPLVVVGPHRLVRHPLYLAVLLLVFGSALLSAATFVLVADGLLLLWYRLVLIPFEERELYTLFGTQFEQYALRVPMLVPFARWPPRNRSRPPGERGCSPSHGPVPPGAPGARWLPRRRAKGDDRRT